MPARNISRDKIGIKAGFRMSVVIRICGSQSEDDFDLWLQIAKTGFALGLSLNWPSLAIRFRHLSNKFPDFHGWYVSAGRGAVAPPVMFFAYQGSVQ